MKPIGDRLEIIWGEHSIRILVDGRRVAEYDQELIGWEGMGAVEDAVLAVWVALEPKHRFREPVDPPYLVN